MTTSSTAQITRRALFGAAIPVTALALAACSSPAPGASGGKGKGTGTVSYWLWDANQLPAYQAVAAAFHKENPDITIEITQLGWGDYWTKLTAGFIADTAPDVFTDHVSKFAQFAELDVLYPLDDLGPTKGIQDDDYQPGLATLWKGQNGKRYGSPKDWDTIAMFYDRKSIRKAGVDPASLTTLEWNPDDGGTFEKMLARLTIDEKGRRGDEPGFDRKHIATYGLATNGSGGDGFGQTQWSPFTGSIGWDFTNKNPWGNHFNYDEKIFQKTLDWYFGLVDKGYMAAYGVFSTTTGSDLQLGSGKAGLALNGSWMIKTFAALKGIEIGIAPTPIGPIGHRASMFNGLGDSITKQARDPEAAAKWVAFLGSDTAQKIVGSQGIVFPARPAGTDAAVTAFAKQGVDVRAFTQQVSEKTTFLFPVTTNAADIQALLTPAIDDIYANGKPASSLDSINDQVNTLLKLA